jgi:hypothetical protein
MDGLRPGGHCARPSRPRDFQGLGAARGITRSLRRHVVDCVRRHVCDVADMAFLKNDYE